MLDRVLYEAGAPSPALVETSLNVSAIGRLSPDFLLCDVDRSEVDALEVLRRLRFVLPDCIIAVYTRLSERTWVLSCHLAGVSCMLSKTSSEAELAFGLREAKETGCFTDPHFPHA